MVLRIAALAAILLAATDLRAQESDLTGRWSGRWESGTTGHSGPLRGTFSRADATHYRVVFRGRFFKVIPFRYAQTLEIIGGQGDALQLAGSSRLFGFGTFEYSATATSHDFTATYRSRNDHGVFILGR